jgi:hypothetical protein
MNILNDYDKKRVNNISLKIDVLRTKKERNEGCVYGPGKPSLGHKCNHCEKNDTICLSIVADIDNIEHGFVTSDKDIIKALKTICNPSLIISYK